MSNGKSDDHEERRLVGAGIGGAVGGVLGALVGGPVGAVIGAAAASWLGHQIGDS